MDWTHFSRHTLQLIHGAKSARGADIHTVGHTDLCPGSVRSCPGREGLEERLRKDSLSHPCYLYVSTLLLAASTAQEAVLTYRRL